jgi:hypothetical protein
MSNQAGKGDKPRPVNKKAYNENFDGIAWSKEIKKPSKQIKGKTVYSY